MMHTERGFDRLVNFSDAVVAIAITLIILPLVDSARDIGHDTIPTFLQHNSGQLWSAGLSFVVIGSFWMNHHDLFERMTGYSSVIVRLNFIWLAGIVFLPLPTVLLVVTDSSVGGSTGTIRDVLYVGTMLISLLSLALVGTIAEHSGLMKDDATSSTRRRWMPVVLMAIALLLTAFLPGAELYPLFLLLVELPVGQVDGARQRKAAARKARGASTKTGEAHAAPATDGGSAQDVLAAEAPERE